MLLFGLLSPDWLFATPWTAVHQASLSFTISQTLLKLMSIELVLLSNHLILCCPLLLLSSIFPSIRVFSNEWALRIRWQSTRVSASASVLPVNIQSWFPLGLTGLICLLPKGLSRVFSSTTVWKHQIFEHVINLSLNPLLLLAVPRLSRVFPRSKRRSCMRTLPVSNTSLAFWVSFCLPNSPGSFLSFPHLPSAAASLAKVLQTQTLWHHRQAHKSGCL